MTEGVIDPTATLLEALDLAATGVDEFEGRSLPQPNGRVFGGQVLAQALLAAGRTVEDGRLPHSLHGYFLRAGVVPEPIAFAVERLRDGRSFTARRTHALQGGEPILSMIASFQVEQAGVDYADEMPTDVPGPDEVPSALDLLGTIDHPAAKFWAHESAFDVRHVGGSIYLGRAAEATGRQEVWFRSRGALPTDQLLHRALLAYACDQVMLEPVLRRSGRSWVTPGMSIASLDHAMWWHRDVRVDDWLLYVQTSPSAQGGRGLGAARVFAQDGTLVASIAQEGMVRFPEA
ncbi:acyl-CoA thioesterase [Cellulomonas fimi]|uniref:Acyl-CoA thioesterase 2 n=1 Tax=Cellulomonas fimi (strain ATCC 484 / DSM 20113 / JCM 1341 / CCUG 24087 / LMG 16345 / NBRC 15513 / NCIMB 8980 / NCTC 7547 / NRS-133) TaxID=590998 RepID=F4H5S6_CELFA|nr:acyl-CoA thioesterase II [Cellulomonas fimi]AEE45526.1 Choloyl-CoA hydrolase [Cellulomonas fimi ATCC 484]NNH05962.1 acyl-CoA thioesterase II [Cellulomonas fimi]VEH29729.1 Acyl-CoA thioesterase 2 [Cellulomonas fimi]